MTADASMRDWYRRYYAAIANSPAYSAFCQRVFGRDLGQHGFSDMAQVEALLAAAELGPEHRVLDLGTGNGAMAAHVAAATGAHVTGIDNVLEAISQAQQMARSLPNRLAFAVADIGHLPFAAASFDVLMAIDTLYFTEIHATMAQLRHLLAPGGAMLLFYSHGADPITPIEVFPRETLAAHLTPLGQALDRQGLAYTVGDFTKADYQHARLKRRVLEDLRPRFEQEGNLFLYENRYGEALGVMAAIEAGAHARYLYHVRT